jgi:hypothetical protein
MAEIIRGIFPAKPKKTDKATAKTTPAAYQLHISLLHTRPLVWRRVQVPGRMRLSRLHEVIQLCLGWTDSHLHQFVIGSNFYAPAMEEDDWSEGKVYDESRFRLGALEADLRQRFIYEYDFGDGWQHEIRIEKGIAAHEKPAGCPILLAGERACPPEDIGGPAGYRHFLLAAGDPAHEDHQEMLDWYGRDFDPDSLAVDAINKILKKMK